MKGAVLGAVVGSLLLIPSTSANAVYPRAADIKRVCASLIRENFKGATYQDETVDGWIEAYSNMSTEKARSEWTGWGGNDASKCVIDQLEAHRRGGKVAHDTGALAPLHPAKSLKAHNPANEASQCLELITKRDYKRRHVTSSVTGAAFRNSCSYPVETRWCIGADRCARLGYDNLATMPASKDRAISYDAPVGVKTETRWAGCRLGFEHRPDLRGTLHYACK